MPDNPAENKAAEAAPAETSRPRRRRVAHFIAALAIVLAMLCLFVMVVNYSFPKFFTVSYQEDAAPAMTDLSQDEAKEMDVAEEAARVTPAHKTGLMFTDTVLRVGDDLFANWLPNDKCWPTILLDNPQNFQLGELEMMRYTMRVMRDMLTKLETTDKIDADCAESFTLLSNDPNKWILPSAESRFQGAMARLRRYRDNLMAGQAEFYPRERSLNEMLGQYISLLGGVNTRLANAPRLKGYRTSLEFAGETGMPRDEQMIDTNVPWYRIDDNFYYAQGVAYVLRQMMVAIRYDFAEVLKRRSATAQMDSVIEVLNEAQFEPWVVLNGSVGSVMANHSMELHSVLENARQKLRNLNDMLK